MDVIGTISFFGEAPYKDRDVGSTVALGIRKSGGSSGA